MAHVQVVLTGDLPQLGDSGDVVKVRAGYARNFLIPRGLAAMATRDNVKRVEHEKRIAAARAVKMRATWQEIADKLAKVTLSVSVQVGEEGKLYGSVTSRDLEEALAAQGFEIDRRKILTDGLKEVGHHKVEVKVGTGVDAIIGVDVVAKES